MSEGYNYDEQGQFFPYFTATFLAMALVPTSISSIRELRSKANVHERSMELTHEFKPANHEIIDSVRNAANKKSFFTRKNLLIVLGWVLFGYMIYLIKTTHVENEIWDPYEVLGIPMSLTEEQIKKHFKKLSVKFHPDKVKLHANQTKEAIEKQFVELTKAYKALTDEEVRRNFIEFGHPDGRQSTSFGIALPKWIVEEGSMYYVLALYGLLFGVALPYAVGRWWYGTKENTKDGISVDTAGRFFKGIKEKLSADETLTLLSSSKEFEKEFADPTDEITLEKKVVQGCEANLQRLTGPTRRGFALLKAHLYRINLGDKKLEEEKLRAVLQTDRLVEALLNIETALAYLPAVETLVRVRQGLVQAIAPEGSPLLQLPGMTKDVVNRLQHDSRIHWNVQRLAALSEGERRRLLLEANLNASLISTVEEAAGQFPVLQVAASFFRVEGEKSIAPESLVQLVGKLRVVPASKAKTPFSTSELEEWTDKTAEELSNAQDTSPMAYCPYFPKNQRAKYYMMMSDPKQKRIIIPPVALTGICDQVRPFIVQFQAPPQVGTYTFFVHFISGTTMGTDVKSRVVLSVTEPSKLEEIEDDISEPDEDTIAGQMQAFKGGKPKKRVDVDSDEDSFEDSDEDAENTDTDSE